MPDYDIGYNGETYTISADHDLSDAELARYAGMVKSGNFSAPSPAAPPALQGSIGKDGSGADGFKPFVPPLPPGHSTTALAPELNTAAKFAGALSSGDPTAIATAGMGTIKTKPDSIRAQAKHPTVKIQTPSPVQNLVTAVGSGNPAAIATAGAQVGAQLPPEDARHLNWRRRMSLFIYRKERELWGHGVGNPDYDAMEEQNIPLLTDADIRSRIAGSDESILVNARGEAQRQEAIQKQQTLHALGTAVNHAVGKIAENTSILPDAGRKLVGHIAESLASGANPISQSEFITHAIQDPLGTGTETGLAINNIWRQTDESGNPIPIEARVDGLITLGGISLGVAGFGDFVRSGIVKGPELNKGIVKLLADGADSNDLGAAIGKGGKSIVQRAERSPMAKQVRAERIVQALGDHPDPYATADKVFIDKNWRQRTEGLINALSQEIDASGSSGKQRQNAAIMRKLRAELRNSLSAGEPHPAILAELKDIRAKQQVTPPAVEPKTPVAEPPIGKAPIEPPGTTSEAPTAPKPAESPRKGQESPVAEEAPKTRWDKTERRFVKNEPPAGVAPDQHGISQAMHEQRGMGVEPGEGTMPEAQLEEGRRQLAAGVDPEARLAQIERGENVTPEQLPKDQALFRAHAEELARQTREAFRTGGDVEAAKAAETDWLKRIKPIATSASEIFRGLQGQTDLDTGDWSALASHARGFKDSPLTDAEVGEAKAKASKVEDLTAVEDRQQGQIDEAITRKAKEQTKTKPKGIPTTKDGLAAHFAARIKDGSLFSEPRPGGKQSGAASFGRGPRFTPEETRALWSYIKENHIDPNPKGLRLEAIAQKVADELGLEPDWVKELIAGRKTPIRELTDAQLRTQFARKDAVNEARHWAESIGNPKVASAVGNLWHGFRSLKTLGHGTVWPVTHVGAGGFDPYAAGASIRGFVNSVKAMNLAQYEAMMQRMEAMPEYPTMREAGLKISRDYSEDYQAYAKLFGKLGDLGNRQMDMLKVYRAERFRQLWADVPAALKKGTEYRKEIAKAIATQVNHESGTVTTNWGALEKPFSEAQFGPNLWRSRWARMVGDPAQTVKTFANWSKATPAERYIAGYRMKRFGRIMATYVGGILGGNWAVLHGLGAKDSDNVNFLDPTRSDWLKLRDLSGNSYDWTGGLLKVPQVLYQVADPLLQSIWKGWGDVDQVGHVQIPKGKSALSSIGDTVFNYETSGLSPQYQLAVDAAKGTDYQGRPLPWASEEQKEKASDKGKPAYSWYEYLVEKTAPIPAEHVSQAIFEGFREEGLSGQFALDLAKAVAVGLIGVRESKATHKVDRDAIGREKTPQSRNDTVLRELGRLGYTHQLTTEPGEDYKHLEQRRQAFGEFAYSDLKAEIESDAYKGLTKTEKLEDLKKVLENKLHEFNTSGPGADFHEEKKAAKEAAHSKKVEEEKTKGVN